VIKPFWSEAPRFLARTSTPYLKVPLLPTLADRGMDNPMLASLVKHLPEGCYIAGGFMMSVMLGKEHESDIDLFFNGPDAFLKALDLFENLPEKPEEGEDEYALLRGYKPTVKREEIMANSETMRFVKLTNTAKSKPPIQLIKLVWYESAEHTIDTFDITVAQFAADRESLVFNPMATLDLARKRLVLHRMQFPASTLRRLVKYSAKGFWACPGALGRIATEIHAAIQEDPNAPDLRNLVYVD
jgi:hypothetical protein